jgi:hypothetical protein
VMTGIASTPYLASACRMASGDESPSASTF